jgi:minor histocompatibility antigen H13
MLGLGNYFPKKSNYFSKKKILCLVTVHSKCTRHWLLRISGLGDIVIPGLFIALMLRWDVVQCAQKGEQLSGMNPPPHYDMRVSSSSFLTCLPRDVRHESSFSLWHACILLLIYWHVSHGLSEGKKMYFYAQMFGYVLGLVTTVIMMIQFKAAQPALLYLVPVSFVELVGLFCRVSRSLL